jgi:subtilisin family serine protease
MYGTGEDPERARQVPAPPIELWDPPITVAVLDSGLDPHPWFATRPWLSDWGLAPERLDGDGEPGQDRQAGHGTFVAGIVLQHAPGVVLRHRRVLSSLGLTDDVTVVSGLRKMRLHAAASRTHVDVVVLASGCHTADNECPPLVRREIAKYRDAVVVASAGNFGTSRKFWPAALPEVLSVAATGPDGRFADFSNRGPWVNAAAPGVDVVSSFVNLQPPSGQAPGSEDRVYGFAKWSGTSFAAPRVAAEVASLRHRGEDIASATVLAAAAFPVPGTT